MLAFYQDFVRVTYFITTATDTTLTVFLIILLIKLIKKL